MVVKSLTAAKCETVPRESKQRNHRNHGWLVSCYAWFLATLPQRSILLTRLSIWTYGMEDAGGPLRRLPEYNCGNFICKLMAYHREWTVSIRWSPIRFVD